MAKFIRRWSRATLVAIYLIIVAGGAVRMTGSGMGCPDWPKCFGRWVPPTSEAELPADYMDYYVEKYLYSAEVVQFNAFNTWTEYINRLIGFMAGNMCLVLLVFTIIHWIRKRKNGWLVALALLVNMMMGFQAWLGATVVYSELNPYRITIHMVMALLIVAVMLILILRANRDTIPKKQTSRHNAFQIGLIGVLVLSVVQVILGTQVREEIDLIGDQMGHAGRETWIGQLSGNFIVHRSFSIAVVLGNAFVIWLNRKAGLGMRLVNVVGILILLEVLTGIGMAYGGIPSWMQLTHLVFASVLFGVQFFILLDYRRRLKFVPADPQLA